MSTEREPGPVWPSFEDYLATRDPQVLYAFEKYLMREAWQARQPEIDALKADALRARAEKAVAQGVMQAVITQRDALQAENQALRHDVEYSLKAQKLIAERIESLLVERAQGSDLMKIVLDENQALRAQLAAGEGAQQS